MSILKKISLILFILMFENIDAEAQFSYTHSDGTVIACKKAPLQKVEYEGSIEAKYVEVINKKLMIYGTSANASNPKAFTRVDVEAVSLAHIAFDQEHLAVMVEGSEDDKPMTVMFIYTSPQTNQTYLNENGVKSKETPSPRTSASIEFPSHTLAKAFVYEVISNLPTERQKEAEAVFEDIYYGMAGEMKRQQDMQARKKSKEENAKKDIETAGVRIEVGRTLYIYGRDLYNGSFEQVAKRAVDRITFGSTEYRWKELNSFIKNGTTIYHNIKTVRDGRTLEIFRDGKKIGTCEKTMVSAENLPEPSEIAAILDYFGL